MRRFGLIGQFGTSLVVAAMVTSCDETAPRGPGSITVAATLSTLEPLFFEYGVTIDSGTPRQGFPNIPLVFTEHGLAHGRHVVAVTGDLPAACGAKPRKEVDLLGDDTANVILSLQCTRTTGDILVSVATAGTDFDLNGYLVLVDQSPRAVLSPNSSTLISFIQPGSHTVSLSDVAPNCTASGSRNVTLAAGAQGSASFSVTCAAGGILKFVVTTAGADRDPDGPVIQIDNGVTQRLGVSGTTNLRVAVGARTFTITDIQPNCALGGPSGGGGTLAQNDTITINVDITCTAIGMGAVGVTVADPAGDTLANQGSNATPALDVLRITGRYATGFMIVVVRFNRAVTSAITESAGSVYGYINFDVDENVSTGIAPASNSYGGNATMGSEYFLSLFSTDTASTELVYTPNVGAFTVIGRVRIRFDADSMMVLMPLNKIENDENVALTLVIGTEDRPTDVVPNAGTFLLRPPASPSIAASVQLRREPMASGRTLRAYDVREWRSQP